jgi:hypothetical protein
MIVSRSVGSPTFSPSDEYAWPLVQLPVRPSAPGRLAYVPARSRNALSAVCEAARIVLTS